MNINSAIPYYIPSQTPRQTLAPLPTNLPSNALTDQEKKEAFAKEFYTREEEPWKGKFVNYGDDTIKNELREMTKDQYLIFASMEASIELSNQYSFFCHFKEQILDARPDLAEKSFSFTLGDDAEIKILDTGKSLSDDDLNWLTSAINSGADFKNSVRQGAKLIMSLVDHDPKNFSGKTNLTLLNFQDIIDLGKVLSNPIDMTEGWMKQVKEHDEKNRDSLIDTYA
ncbi:hypothetical protein V2K52_06160 [Pseudomonas alliivorans]|nr:hypothetical protein [Pseudomonas alliivorans]MEE4792226.1 hypothetical protein [Pseudomonas alliivorans]MEE4796671.1 hypothetical protein [Pseudomonas alliivorans]MEE4806465.1 hypothetical protein [Pseudomonas alliivorans]MEE4821974.1 hypothetical protein [Pseudomonas alliivorans]